MPYGCLLMDLPIPPAPLPNGKGVVSACVSVLHTCCLTPFSYRQPLPIGKGPPAGREIGRRVRWQSLGTFETDYGLRRQKTALSFVVSLICVLWLPAHGSPYPPCPPSHREGGSFCLRICLAYLLPDAILVSSAPSHREGAARRAGDRETGALAVARHI